MPSSDCIRLSIELRNFVIQLPEFNTAIALQELLGSGCRADIVRIFSLNNEMVFSATNVKAVFCAHLPDRAVICESAVWFNR